MPICPRCGRDIRYLLSYCKVYEAYIYNGEEYVMDSSRDIIDTISDIKYVCLYCPMIEEAERL